MFNVLPFMMFDEILSSSYSGILTKFSYNEKKNWKD